MKTVTSAMTAALALAVMTAASAHAQTAFETMTTSSTETVGNVTTNVKTQYVSTTTLVPVGASAGVKAVVGDAPGSAAVAPTGTVNVKLPSGDVINVADSDAAPWNKDSRLSGYDRFTFDAVSGDYVAGMGDAKYATKWDENGNPVKAPAPVKKKVAKKVVKKVAAEETTTTEAPAGDSEAPATAAPAEAAPVETPAANPASVK